MVHEWSVMATDFLLAMACLWCAQDLMRTPHARTVARAMGIGGAAAFVGGLRHGLGPWLPDAVYGMCYFASYALIPVAFIVLAVGIARTGIGSARWLVVAVALTVWAFAVWLGFLVGTQGTLHDDLFHLAMIPAVFAFYRAVAPSHR